MTQNNSCLCGSSKNYAECCGRFIEGNELPQTPEELMRSRYTAYAQMDLDYIAHTMLPPASDHFDADEERRAGKSIQWLELNVLHASQMGNKGTVEFEAHFLENDKEMVLHELSHFRREDGRWFYVDGEAPVSSPVRVEKINRNSPCPCGSGKKYKKCCAG